MDKLLARKLVTNINPKSIVSEQYRTIRTNINFSMPDKELKTLLFTSAYTGEGKSTSAANVAIVFAQEGKKVLLVDADMRKPTMHYTFHTTNSPGLSNLLTRQWNLDDVLKDSGVEGLQLITCGQIPPNPAELLGSKSMDALLDKLKEDMTSSSSTHLQSYPLQMHKSYQINVTGRFLSSIQVTTEKDSVKRAKEALQIFQSKHNWNCSE